MDGLNNLAAIHHEVCASVLYVASNACEGVCQHLHTTQEPE